MAVAFASGLSAILGAGAIRAAGFGWAAAIIIAAFVAASVGLSAAHSLTLI